MFKKKQYKKKKTEQKQKYFSLFKSCIGLQKTLEEPV